MPSSGSSSVGAGFRRRLREHWFLAGILASIGAAWIDPAIGAHGGPIRPEFTVKIVCVSVIFLVSGVSIRTRELVQAVLQWRLHLTIQAFTFAAVPAFVQLASPVVAYFFSGDPGVLDGVVTLSCMPPPVSSAVILTKAVGGNEAAAVFNSALGSLLGVFLTPALLLKLVGTETTISASSVILQLSLTVLAPLALGQAIRSFVLTSGDSDPASTGEPKKRVRNLSWVGQCALLVIIYSTFCDAFKNRRDRGGGIDLHKTASVIIFVIVFQICAMSVLFSLSRRWSFFRSRFSPADAACLIFCGVHKSLTLGIPILNVLYEDSPDLPLICLPLLAYHPVQILLGGMVAPYYRNYIRRRSTYGLDTPVV